MRTARVFTNHRCNQACAYCTFRRAEDDRAAIQGPAIAAELARAAARGAAVVFLSGGEPTLRADLPALIARARRVRVEPVLETNATLVDAALAARLRAAGLSRALVNLSGASARLDATTQDPGGFDATVGGIRALVAAGIEVEVQAAVVRSTRDGIEGVPVLAASLGARALVMTVPTESPDAGELLLWDEACEAIARVLTAARGVGLPVRLSAEAAPPPCAFPEGLRMEHLYGSLTGGGGRRDGYRHVEACEACLVRASCPGVAEGYLARDPRPTVRPVVLERTRRRLTLLGSVEAQVRRELVSPSRAVDPSGAVAFETIVRVNFHCNQACAFCFVSTHLPPPDDDAVRAAILEAVARGSRVVLSGGEPTLNARLAEYVRLASGGGARDVQLQTNAVALADGARVGELADAGLGEAFVSLHGATGEISDRVTAAPGTFARTCEGIDRLAETAIRLTLNFVLCTPNHREATAFVRLVASRWPGASVNFSFVAPSSNLVPRTTELIPRYSDVLPSLGAATDLARALGVPVVGMASMCGLPLCLVPGGPGAWPREDIPAGFDDGEFVKGAACGSCAARERCYGLRRGYAAMYGDEELVPFAAMD